MNTCQTCGLRHNEVVWAVKHKGRVTGWYRYIGEANRKPMTIGTRFNKNTGRYEDAPNPRRVVVKIKNGRCQRHER